MAIVKMKKLRVVALSSQREQLLRQLLRLGCVEVSQPEEILSDPRWAELLLGEVAFVDRMFGGFIDGKILDSLIIGVLCYLGCWILRIPNTLLISVFVGVTNIIPFFGPFIGAVFAAAKSPRKSRTKPP